MATSYIHSFLPSEAKLITGDVGILQATLVACGEASAHIHWGSILYNRFADITGRVGSEEEYTLLLSGYNAIQTNNTEQYSLVRTKLMAKAPSSIAQGVNYYDQLIHGFSRSLENIIRDTLSNLPQTSEHILLASSQLERTYADLVISVGRLKLGRIDLPNGLSIFISKEYQHRHTIEEALSLDISQKLRMLPAGEDTFHLSVSHKELAAVSTNQPRWDCLTLSIEYDLSTPFSLLIKSLVQLHTSSGKLSSVTIHIHETSTHEEIARAQMGLWYLRFILGNLNQPCGISPQHYELAQFADYLYRNKFQYSCEVLDNSELLYTETLNGHIVRQYTFDETEHFILSHAGTQCHTYTELLEAYKAKLNPEVLELNLIHSIDILRSEGLLYASSLYEELVSVLDVPESFE